MKERSTAWRDHSGFVAWPTVGLALLAVTLWLGNLVSHAAGWVPWFVTLPVGIALAYISFTPLHEATHGNVSGGVGGWSWLDDAVGWLAGLPLMAPFPAVKVVHLHHHAHTNDPDEDPDHHIHGTGWTALRGALGMWAHYIVVYVGDLSLRSEPVRRARPWVLGSLLALFGVVATLVATGLGTTAVAGLLLPAWWGVATLAFAFDWLPHWPHTDRGRYTNTRVIPDRWLDLPLLGQNLHLVHHLWPRVPFYRYRAVYEATRVELQAHGSPIEPIGRVTARVANAP